MYGSSSEVLNENFIEMTTSSVNVPNVDISQAGTAGQRSDVRPVSPTFLQALGLIKITTEKTTVTSVPLSKSRGTDTDKNAGGSHTSASKELIRPHKKRSQSKSVAATSTVKENFLGKKEHVSKPKDRTKKRSHATSFDEPQTIPPVVSVKKVRKPAAPATDKPTIKKKPKDVKKQQHKASPPATKVSSSAAQPTVMTAEHLSELTSVVDKLHFWADILESDFKSVNYTMLLKDNQFTEERAQAIQKSFQYLCRMFCRRPTKLKRYMRTHECIECNFSISHECMSMNSSEHWNFGGIGPYINFITPESANICLCDFTVFHSHSQGTKSKSKLQAGSLEPSPLPSTALLSESNCCVNFECPTCSMKVSIANRRKAVCTNLRKFISSDGPARKKFFRYVTKHLDYPPNKCPLLDEMYTCSDFCCMLFHRCAEDVIRRNSVPIQPHRPLFCCEPKGQIEKGYPPAGCIL